MPTSELLPCPFCGSTKYLENTWTSLGFGVVICSKCEAEGPHTASNHICETQANEAAELWNTRATTPAPAGVAIYQICPRCLSGDSQTVGYGAPADETISVRRLDGEIVSNVDLNNMGDTFSLPTDSAEKE